MEHHHFLELCGKEKIKGDDLVNNMSMKNNRMRREHRKSKRLRKYGPRTKHG